MSLSLSDRHRFHRPRKAIFGGRHGRGIGLLLLLLTGTTALANNAPAEQALSVIRSGTDALLTSLNREQERLREQPALGHQRVTELLAPHVDFVTIGRLLLGPHWREASVEQREAFTAEFRKLLIRSYATALIEFVLRRGLSHDDIEYLPPIATRDGGRVLVRTRLRADQGPPVPIHYSMRLSEGEWKVYDVAVDAVSLVSTYRSSFNREIQQHGIDGLIARLSRHDREHNASTR